MNTYKSKGFCKIIVEKDNLTYESYENILKKNLLCKIVIKNLG